MSYFILFISAFASATLLPMQSEALLFTFLITEKYTIWVLLFYASLGNILGSCVNWWLGVRIEQYKHKKWFPVSEEKLLKAQQFYQRYGSWSLLLSWVPIIGDPITLVAGLLKERFLMFLLFVSIAKIGRYLFIYGLYLQV